MMWFDCVRLVAAALLLTAGPIPAQPPASMNTPSSPPASMSSRPKPQFFAGTVTDLTSERITVSRNIIGRSTEKRTFRINKKTKMNKALRLKSRVTVRYQHLPEGDVALEIQIRPRTRST